MGDFKITMRDLGKVLKKSFHHPACLPSDYVLVINHLPFRQDVCGLDHLLVVSYLKS